MVDGTAVKEMERVAQEAIDAKRKVVDIDGYGTFQLVRGELQRLPRVRELIEPKPLVVHTLSALVDYLNSALDDQKIEATAGACALHIVSPTRVDFVTSLQGEHQQRFCFIRAELIDRMGGFRFGEYYDREWFNVHLQTRFVDNADRPYVLKLIGNLRDDTSVTVKDDGVTQKVETRAGITMVDYATIKTPVTLAPFRTFPDIEQPVSPFVLRVKSTDQGPRAALFEADGGAWQLDAIALIRVYLKGNTTIAIIG